MTFTALVREIAATYPSESRAYHVLATRYYLGAETRESLREQATTRPVFKHAEVFPHISPEQAEQIIRNR